MFTKEAQNKILHSISNQSETVIQEELNRKAKKLEEKYMSIKYSITENLIESAKVNIDNANNLNINIKLNPNIEFEDIEKQNIPLVLERGGAIKVKNGKPAMVGGHFLKNALGIKI